MFNQLATAIALAAKIHECQIGRDRVPYILHPIRMMMRLRTDDQELMAITILHDVVEDSDLTIFNLKEMGFSDRIVNGVDSLTRRKDESYMEFVKRCSENPDGICVKMEDLKDNSDITRLKGLRDNDFKRMQKYHKAYMFLKNKLD